MDSALNIETGEIVEANHLQMASTVKQDSFVCRGCGVRLWPASYKLFNLVNPYFTLGPRGNHLVTCPFGGRSSPSCLGRGLDGRLNLTPSSVLNDSPSTVELPLRMPAKLILQDSRSIEAVQKRSRWAVKPIYGSSAGGALPPVPSETAHNRDAHAIHPICRAFVDYPNDRSNTLAIAGVAAHQYRTVFKRLKWDALCRYAELRIFYAAMRWSPLIEDEQRLIIGLDAGERVGGRLLRGHDLSVLWQSWRVSQRMNLRRELTVAQRRARLAYQAGQRSIKAFVFFLGRQDDADLCKFSVSDARLVCCVVGAIHYPTW